MTKQQIADKINQLILIRDTQNADNQSDIDALFEKFESMCDFSTPFDLIAGYESAMLRFC